MQVGFIGLGAMGLPMARHLVEAGHQLTVASRSRRTGRRGHPIHGREGGACPSQRRGPRSATGAAWKTRRTFSRGIFPARNWSSSCAASSSCHRWKMPRELPAVTREIRCPKI